jgi:regulation of enolase protein 1 (concanavalin A-like superfamily)
MTKELLFEDTFQGTIDSDWQWLREAPEAWRLKVDALNIQALPGTLWGERNDARNILLRPAMEVREGLSSEVTVRNHPEIQGEQGGLIWYVDDANYVKLVKECLDDSVWIVLAREENDQGTLIGRVPFAGEAAHIRLTLSGGAMVGEVLSEDGATWQTVGTCAGSATDYVQLGICVHGGPGDEEHWAELSEFAIRA